MLKKIVWALDPFEGEPSGWEGARDLIARLERQGTLKVKPVHVFSTHELELAADMLAAWTLQYLPKVEDSLREFIDRLGLRSLEEPTVLVQSSSSFRQGAELLSRYAKIADSDTILVSTHGRSGFSRLLSGSFAEALMSQAEIPVLVTRNSTSKTEEGFGTVFYPTDLITDGTLERAIELCRGFGARLVIAHVHPLSFEPFVAGNGFVVGDSWIPYRQYAVEDANARRELVQEWAETARASGIDAVGEVIVGGFDVSQALLEGAKRHRAGLIFMATRTRELAATLLGSVTRQLARQAECPVLVAPPIESAESSSAA